MSSSPSVPFQSLLQNGYHHHHLHHSHQPPKNSLSSLPFTAPLLSSFLYLSIYLHPPPPPPPASSNSLAFPRTSVMIITSFLYTHGTYSFLLTPRLASPHLPSSPHSNILFHSLTQQIISRCTTSRHTMLNCTSLYTTHCITLHLLTPHNTTLHSLQIIQRQTHTKYTILHYFPSSLSLSHTLFPCTLPGTPSIRLLKPCQSLL